jgi:glutathione peroxidase
MSANKETGIYQFSATDAKGNPVDLKQFKGKVLLIANTASACGFTPQYKGLQVLHEQFGQDGLVVLGFPCNQFGGQEPGSDKEIQSFCELNYGVTFPVLSKVDVNGSERHPLFGFLTEAAPGLLGSEAIKWNFTKFLVSRDGAEVKRFAPQDSPESMSKQIAQWLAKG